MKGFLKKINPQWPLRLGLGFTYLYSGTDIFYHPSAWTWAVPSWFAGLLPSFLSIENYLRIQGFGEIVLALLFFAWFSQKWGVRIAAILSSLEIAAILLFTGIDPVTFRDLGVLGASLALLLLAFNEENGASPEKKI